MVLEGLRQAAPATLSMATEHNIMAKREKGGENRYGL